MMINVKRAGISFSNFLEQNGLLHEIVNFKVYTFWPIPVSFMQDKISNEKSNHVNIKLIYANIQFTSLLIMQQNRVEMHNNLFAFWRISWSKLISFILRVRDRSTPQYRGPSLVVI